jgi:hypothetical protein
MWCSANNCAEIVQSSHDDRLFSNDTRRSESSTDIMAEKRIHHRPQHQLSQQERTFRQARVGLVLIGEPIDFLAGHLPSPQPMCYDVAHEGDRST